MATSTVIPDDIKTLKGDVSKAKEDISSKNGLPRGFEFPGNGTYTYT